MLKLVESITGECISLFLVGLTDRATLKICLRLGVYLRGMYERKQPPTGMNRGCCDGYVVYGCVGTAISESSGSDCVSLAQAPLSVTDVEANPIASSRLKAEAP